MAYRIKDVFDMITENDSEDIFEVFDMDTDEMWGSANDETIYINELY